MHTRPTDAIETLGVHVLIRLPGLNVVDRDAVRPRTVEKGSAATSDYSRRTAGGTPTFSDEFT